MFNLLKRVGHLRASGRVRVLQQLRNRRPPLAPPRRAASRPLAAGGPLRLASWMERRIRNAHCRVIVAATVAVPQMAA